jgi:uncharacterized membrane protein YbhN (UPF0104 family)
MIEARRFRWRLPLTVLATVALVFILVRDLGGRDFESAVCGARFDWVAVAFLASIACVILGAARWALVLSCMGYRVGFGRSLEVVLATWPPAVVTPSRANDLLRAFAVREVVPLAAGTGSVLAEKAIDLFVLLAFAGIAAALRALWLWSGAMAFLLVAESGAIALAAARRQWLARLPILRRPGVLEGLLGAFDSLRRAPGKLLSICAVSLAIRILTIGVVHALLVSVGSEVRLFDTVTLWPAAMLVGTAPVTMGGMGTRDAAFIYLLRARGVIVAPSAVLAATMGYSAVAIWSFAVIGLPLMVREALFRRSLSRPGL